MTSGLFSKLLRYLQVPSIGVGVVALALSVAILSFVETRMHRPLVSERDEVRSQLVALQIQFDNTAQRILLAEQFGETKLTLEALDSRLAVDETKTNSVSELAALSQQAGTRIIHGANSLGKPRLDVTPVLQELTLEGDYAAIIRFVDGLSALSRLTLLRQFEINGSSENNRLRAKLSLMTLSKGGGAADGV